MKVDGTKKVPQAAGNHPWVSKARAVFLKWLLCWYTGVCVAGGPGARRLGAGRLLDTKMQVIIFLSIQYRYLFD